MTGQVVWVREDKGYGFIRPHGGDKTNEIFFHSANLEGLTFGQHLQFLDVNYDVAQSERGPRAIHVRGMS